MLHRVSSIAQHLDLLSLTWLYTEIANGIRWIWGWVEYYKTVTWTLFAICFCDENHSHLAIHLTIAIKYQTYRHVLFGQLVWPKVYCIQQIQLIYMYLQFKMEGGYIYKLTSNWPCAFTAFWNLIQARFMHCFLKWDCFFFFFEKASYKKRYPAKCGEHWILSRETASRAINL